MAQIHDPREPRQGARPQGRSWTTARKASTPARKPLPLTPKPLASRPRLTAAIVLGVVVGLGFALVPNGLGWTTRAILTWDVACGFFLVATFSGMRAGDTDSLRQRAAFEDEGGAAVLLLSLVATIASLGAVAAELEMAKHGTGLEKGARVGLGFLTVALSWTFVHLIFALHYAREFYAPDGARAGATRGGLEFPGTKTPDYWDFVHFAMVIGVASQTADIAFTSQGLRRIGTVHSVIAFLFNTVILAISINFAASLF
jgi:uncharacterized membrane protein